jgi:hypothetical protein
MLRTICAIAVVLALGGCDRASDSVDGKEASAPRPAAAPARMMAGMTADKRAEPEGPKLAYSHNLSIETKADTVKQRFEQARDACLNGTIAGCVLLNANIEEVGFDRSRHPVATLSVRLTHEAVAPFEQAVLKPLPGEQASDVAVVSRSTSAEDLTAVIQDGDRRLAQLTDYRDRLTQLAKRGDAKVEDLIKVQSELSTTQSQIEELTAQQKRLGERVATELETVQIIGKVAVGQGSDIAEVWHRGAQILDGAIADSLHFLIAAVPWIVTVLVVMILLPIVRILVRVLWRIGRPRI